MPEAASFWIDRLALAAHPEGGFYRETYRSSGTIPGGDDEHPAGRAYATAIYYLLRSSEVSRLHRLKSDELFHHYAGAPLTVHVLSPAGGYERRLVGDDLAAGAAPQLQVGAGCWFGATVERPDSFALVGCTVAPGFSFDDFDIAERERLVAQYPEQRALIERLT